MTQLLSVVSLVILSVLPGLIASDAFAAPDEVTCVAKLGDELHEAGGSMKIDRELASPEDGFDYHLSFNAETQLAKLDIRTRSQLPLPVMVELLLLPGESIEWSAFDTFGGPEMSVRCQRLGVLTTRQAPMAAKCVGISGELGTTQDPADRDRLVLGGIAGQRQGKLGTDTSGTGWNLKLSAEMLELVTGEAHEHLLNAFRVSAHRGQKLRVVEKVPGTQFFTEASCEIY